MNAINENIVSDEVTRAICDRNPDQVTVAQVKEVQRALLRYLATYKASEVMELVERHAGDCCS